MGLKNRSFTGVHCPCVPDTPTGERQAEHVTCDRLLSDCLQDLTVVSSDISKLWSRA